MSAGEISRSLSNGKIHDKLKMMDQQENSMIISQIGHQTKNY